MYRGYPLTVAILFLSLIANAQDQAETWDNLKTLGVGQKIRVVYQTLEA